MMPYRRDSIVVMDFWEVEYPEGGTDDGEDGGSGGEEDSDDVEEGDNVIVGENSVEAERSDGKDDPEDYQAVQEGRMRDYSLD